MIRNKMFKANAYPMTPPSAPPMLAVGKFNYSEVGVAGIGYQIHTDALIKAHKSAAMDNGKRQEVAIGDLACAQHPLPTDEALVQQADLPRPENVAVVVASFLEPLRHLGYRPMVRISGLGHDPEHAVLRDRARGPAVV